MKEKKEEEQFIYWKEILLMMYNLDINGLYFDKKNNLIRNEKYDLIKKKLNYDDAKIENAVRKLRKMNYLEASYYDKNGKNLKSFITKEGIEISIKLQEQNDNKKNNQKQEMNNKMVFLFTLFLGIASVAEISNFFIINFGISNILIKYSIFLSFICVFGIFGCLSWNSNNFFEKNN